MANKTKKISINALENAIKENYVAATTVNWNDLDIIIKRNLTIDETCIFVDKLIEVCFDKEDGLYRAEFKDFAIRAIAIELYTNVTLPSDIRKQYDIVYRSNIWNILLENINIEQFNAILDSVDRKIDNALNANISVMQKQANELYNAIDNIQQQLSSIFGGVNGDDIKNLVGAISNGNITEEKLMQAYIKEHE